MFRRHVFLASSLLAALWCTGVIASAGNTTCASSQLDWYTSVVGETPCATYQRLRQICNSDYLVPQFRTDTPGDNCDDQLSTCCCNSISWALSMLCMNCQYDTATGGTGIDAGNGAYALYSSTCGGNPVNKTLPADIQTAVCNREIKIDRNLYSLFWDTGAWYYVYTKETMTKDFAATNNNTFTHCNSTLKASAAASAANPTLTSSSTSSSTSGAAQSTSSAATGSSTNLAPILGGAIGGVAVALLVALIGFILFRRQRRRQGPKPLDLSKEYSERSTPDTDQQPMSVVTPYSISGQSNSGYGGGKLTMSEEFALLPRSPRSPGTHHYTESSASSKSPSNDARDPDRHEDAGPIPALQRSASGRLPPAYRSWEASDQPVPELPVYDLPPPPPVEGGSMPAGPSDAVTMEYRGQPPLGDVKVRPPS